MPVKRQTDPRRLLATTFLVLGLAAGATGAAGPLGGGTSPAGPSCPAPVASRVSSPTGPATWAEVDRLIAQVEYQAALERVGALREAARAAGDEEDWARALIREVQLRSGLGGYETAVRFLREQPWPSAPLQRSILDLFYAQALLHYLKTYSWEIYQRVEVVSGDEVDLEAWTREQILGEAERAYALVWQERESWGAEPVGVLGEHVQPNDYPARIRGTLRDAVTYLWVELLADTSLWGPAHSQEVFRLDLPRLLAVDPQAAGAASPQAAGAASPEAAGAAGPEAAGAVDLADPAVHPLVRMVALLADLEAWHAAAGRPEAAFEARLERLRRLSQSFSEAEDRRAIRADLSRRLDALGRGHAWWSMGQAVLAEMLMAEEAPGSLAAAHRHATAGARAHPRSPGGWRCRRLAAKIEAPEYEISAMASDGLGRRSLLVRHKNLPALHFRAYRFDLVRYVEEHDGDRGLLPDAREIERLLGVQKPREPRRPSRPSRPDLEWSVELPPTPDYHEHSTHVTPPFVAPGLYVVVASARRDFARERNRRQAVHLVAGDLVLLTRDDGLSTEVTVLAGGSGRPVAGATVHVYGRDPRRGYRRLESRRTDAEGRITYRPVVSRDDRPFLIAQNGDDAAISLDGIGPVVADEPREETSALLFTDRSIYRPQQELLWKAVAYRREDGGTPFRTLPAAKLTVELVDANGEVVESAAVETNGFGSASGRFLLPAGRRLGWWQLRTSLGGEAGVHVEEYKRPAFEVALDDPQVSLRLNRPATLGGSARYYFGLPVASGKVSWLVTRGPLYPSWWSWEVPSSERHVASGEAALDGDGRFRVTFTPEADERLARVPGMRFVYRLWAEVVDEGGEAHEAERWFRLGFAAVEAAIESESGFFHAGRPAAVEVRRTDLDGVPRPGRGSWRLLALAGPPQALLPADQPVVPPPGEAAEPYSTAGDRLRPRWEGLADPVAILRLWPDGEEIRRGSALHGRDGVARLSLPALPPGAYRLRYETGDGFGATFETQREWIVARGGAPPVALPALLLPERSVVPVGGTARILVQSGLPGQELVVEVLRGEERIAEHRLAAGTRILEIPVTAADRGGIGLRLTGVRDHQLLAQAALVAVPWDDRRLEVGFSTFRDLLRPGGRETWRVTVRGAGGKALAPGAVELLASMYDRSLDLFVPHQPADPLALYPVREDVKPARSSLEPSWAMFEDGHLADLPADVRLQGDRLTFLDVYGIRGPAWQRLRAKGATAPMSLRVEEDGVYAEETIVVTGEVSEMAMFAAVGASVSAKAPPSPPASPPSPGEELRSDFAETAFWHPHLVLGEDGAVAFELTVPDAATEWQVWVRAVTRDLAAGSLERRARSVKDLLVRPYLPRFLREGDRAEIKVVVNNAGAADLAGRLDFDVIDVETEESVLAELGLSKDRATGVPFAVAAGGGTTLTFPVTAPRRLGAVAFKVTARAGDLADGELRPLPILPGRVHLAQSRFATLNGRDGATLRFPDMAAGGDPTLRHDQLVVTLDGQLFDSVLRALPYLVDYPYDCTEQTLNRFLSTGILASLFDDYPAVARRAAELAKREAPLEPWEATDPNGRMALEETPWIRPARGERGEHGESDPDLLRLLDPRVARAQGQASLAKLRDAQTAQGGFPWWPGGPPSPYMTLYVVQGLSRALEHGVEVPKDLVARAWSYLYRDYAGRSGGPVADGCCRELVTFLGYVLSSYPDDSWTGGVFTAEDRRRMLDLSFEGWQRHPPLLKGYLALTLHRAGRDADAARVWDSVMDSARTTEEEGTFWAPEDRAWLWYNDTVESHAFALRVLQELSPSDPRRHGLVQWLLLDKKLEHWKSTRATAEAIYALVHYMQAEGALGVREEATVTLGARRERFTFEPGAPAAGRARIVVPGPEVEPAAMSAVTVEKETPGFLFASATWHFSTERLPAEARGDLFGVTRRYFKRVERGGEQALEPLEEGARLAPGDELEVHLSITARHAAEYVHLRDPRGAGFEPAALTSGYRWELGLGRYEEVRDSGVDFFFDQLPAGQYTLRYRLRAHLAGTFRVGPATLQSMYAPEFAAYSAGAVLEVAP